MKNKIAFMFFFNITFLLFLTHSMKAQHFEHCEVSLKYSEGEMESSDFKSDWYVDLFIQIPKEGNGGETTNYFIHKGEMETFDSYIFYCSNYNDCKIEDVINTLNQKGMCQIIIEYENGRYYFLSEIDSGLKYFTDHNMFQEYYLFTKNKGMSLVAPVYQKCIVTALNYPVSESRFRLYISLMSLDIKTCTLEPVNFKSDWLFFEELIEKK